MIFRFPCTRTDKVGLTRSMIAARLFIEKFFPTEEVICTKYNKISMSVDVCTVGECSRVIYVSSKEVLEGNY